MIINSDHIVDIFVNKTRDTVYAETDIDRDFICLGEYKDRDTSLRVLDGLLLELESMASSYVMPLSGEV